MKQKAIEIKDLVIDYGNSIAVNKINLEVEKGELVTLLGPSGCGKSTTLNALAGLITSTSGRIYFDGTDVTKFSPKERDIGLVFQSYALYPHMTVYKNIAFPLLANDKFKNEIKAKNNTYDQQVLKYKYELAGGKDYDKLWNEYSMYKDELESLNEELNAITFKTKNKIKNAKELKSQVKVRREGRIKSSAEESLKFITDNESKIEDIRTDAKFIRASEMPVEEQEVEINKLKVTLEELQTQNKTKFNEYVKKVEEIKNDYKKEIEESKEEKIKMISEAKEKFAAEKERINNSIESLKQEKESKAIAALEKIKSVANGFENLTKEQQEQIDEILANKVSWKFALDRKIREVAERVGITDQLDKKVTQLSGGQQQRVAISRTLVKSPKVLLLDEPLSNLDAKMRVQTREWIRNLQQELGITTVFVTHDQEEAMSISDKVVCMSRGHIQQVDEPMEMYHNPANKFVAGFLGMPQMNFIEKTTPLGKKLAKLTNEKELSTLGIRPEHVKTTKEAEKGTIHELTIDVKVLITESFGREKLVTAKYGEEIIRFFTDCLELGRDDKVTIGFRKEKIYLFNDQGHGDTIGRI